MAITLAAARRALVIGNQAYGENELRNPVNDARLVAGTLYAINYTVTAAANVDKETFEAIVNSFTNAIRADDEVLFYFSGHGVQIDGVNYLLPVGREFRSTADVKNHAVSLYWIMDNLEKANLSLMFLDACRDNPFTRSYSRDKGLAAVNSGDKNMFVMYSTAEGRTAEDGVGDNSIFTLSLAKQLRTPFMSIDELGTNIIGDVRKDSQNKQLPWKTSNLGFKHLLNLGIQVNEVDTKNYVIIDYAQKKVEEQNKVVVSNKPLPPVLPPQPKAKPFGKKVSEWFGKVISGIKPSRFIDFRNSAEYIYNASDPRREGGQFANIAWARAKLSHFGVELQHKLIMATFSDETGASAPFRKQEYDITQYGIGAGLYDANNIRLFFTVNRYVYKHQRFWDEYYEEVPGYTNYTANFAKRVGGADMELEIGADYLFNPKSIPGGFNYYSPGFVASSFDRAQLDYFPKWRISSYLYTTSIYPESLEPVFLRGITPSDRPMLFNHAAGHLFGLRLNIQEYDFTDGQGFITRTNDLDFTAMYYKSFSGSFGLDAVYTYGNATDKIADASQAWTNFMASMRISFIDLDPIVMVGIVDYTNFGYLDPDPSYEVRSDNYLQGLNGSMYLFYKLRGWLVVNAFAQYLADWYPDTEFFDFRGKGFKYGVTFGMYL